MKGIEWRKTIRGRVPFGLRCRSVGMGAVVSVGIPFVSDSLSVSVGAENDPPNVLFILADDWGWGDLSLHGHPVIQTPNLDRFAGEGMSFAQFNVHTTCSPSRAALVTGKYAGRFFIQHALGSRPSRTYPVPDWLCVDAVMLPRLFQQAGYKTALYGKWHLAAYDAPSAPHISEYGYDEASIWSAPNGPQLRDLGEEYWTEEFRETHAIEWDRQMFSISSEIATRKTMDFIRRSGDAPFFVSLHIREPHTPLRPLPSHREPYLHIPEPEQTYYATVTNADRFLGELFDFLDEEGLRGNTIVIFASDNGPEVPTPDPESVRHVARGETGGFRGRKRSLFEGGVRVPFFIRWPGEIPAGYVNTNTVMHLVDMLPTLCAAAGIPLPEGYESDGENLLSAFLKGNEIRRTTPLFNSFFYTDKVNYGGPIRWKEQLEEKWQPHDWPNISIREGDMKLVYEYATDLWDERIELYDMAKDPYETTDISGQHPELTRELLARVKAWADELPLEPLPGTLDPRHDCFEGTRPVRPRP